MLPKPVGGLKRGGGKKVFTAQICQNELTTDQSATLSLLLQNNQVNVCNGNGLEALKEYGICGMYFITCRGKVSESSMHINDSCDLRKSETLSHLCQYASSILRVCFIATSEVIWMMKSQYILFLEMGPSSSSMGTIMLIWFVLFF